MPSREITLKGERELLAQFNEIANLPNTKKVETQLLKAARRLRDKIRSRAPSGPTGNLRKRIVAKRYKIRIRNFPQVYVQAQAPHAFLVEYGTAGPRTATDKLFRTTRTKSPVGDLGVSKKSPGSAKEAGGYWTFYLDGQFYRVKSISKMPANPFFHPTVDTEKDRVYDDIYENVWEKIKEISDQKR